METGTRAERADEGISVGLGSRNALRDPSEQRKLEKMKRKKQKEQIKELAWVLGAKMV